MQQTLSEKIDKYKSSYLVPVIFYTDKDKGILRRKVEMYPSLTDYFMFSVCVFKEILGRGAILLASKIKKSYE